MSDEHESEGDYAMKVMLGVGGAMFLLFAGIALVAWATGSIK